MHSLLAKHLLVGVFFAVRSTGHFWCPQNEEGLCEKIEDFFSEQQLRDHVLNVSSAPKPSSSDTVDASTIQNKVLAGYQGWAGAGKEWEHWAKDRKVPDPSKGNEHFEMVPDVREYPSGALHDTNFEHNGDGSVMKLYENAKEGVVDLHFQWMKEYGMDGVLLQRFIHDCKPGVPLTQRNTILKQMDAAAAKHGRVYAMMWDMSGANSSWDQDIKNDWTSYVKKYSSNQQYLKEHGKPVVCIYGMGIANRPAATASKSLGLIKWLQSQGLYVIGSGPYYWRTGGHDAASGFDKVHAALDAIMPWAVGRFQTVADFNHQVPRIQDDISLTSSRNQGYAPVSFAGYSYREKNKINEIKRNAGLFFQAQIDSHLQTKGVTFYYIAMFDEVQEGTAIYKFASNFAESAKGRTFVTADMEGVACPGDHYLTMAGQYAAAAHGGPAPSPTPSPTPSPSHQDRLAPGEKLSSGSSLVSANGKARLTLQSSDGNMVLHSGSSEVWSSKTEGHPNAELDFQSDGNLILRDGSKVLWSSGSSSGAVDVKLQDDCNLVTRDSSGKSLWSLGTHCSSASQVV